ncbi:MAG: 1,4-dihydroxy-2-naphthoate octaprenyltransferase [Muribaculaceae bacterium]|nr:1,4-dihydroxy-2-naphthoate octaprenyltransferase [Muribaculaceae bacterium]
MNPWIEAIRLRTLPASIAGVIGGSACAIFYDSFKWLPALCCMLFALGAQIAANFANEYFDFRNGIDKKGREGFRRGVTEGDISPAAMLRAVIITLIISAIPGCALVIWGGWQMIPIGIIIAIFALAYSTGPYPLSRKGLGDIAVLIFFGLVPVILTAWLQNHSSSMLIITIPVGIGIGLLAVNILIVNNYRDYESDRTVGKKTTVVIFGRRTMSGAYLISAIIGCLLLCTPACIFGWEYILPAVMIPSAVKNWRLLKSSEGKALNDLLRRTGIVLLKASLLLLLESIVFILIHS